MSMTTEPDSDNAQAERTKTGAGSTASFPRFFLIAGVGFVIATFFVFYLASKIQPTAEKTYEISQGVTALPTGVFQMTIDARNNGFWVPLSLSTGKEVGNKKDADLLLMRYFLRAPSGAIDLGAVPLEQAKLPADPQWVQDEKHKGQTQNKALADWYEYSGMSHVLKATEKTSAIRLRSGGIAYFRILSYYCKPEGSGCVTFRYRLEKGGSI
jgi:hypothetical protein